MRDTVCEGEVVVDALVQALEERVCVEQGLALLEAFETLGWEEKESNAVALEDSEARELELVALAQEEGEALWLGREGEGSADKLSGDGEGDSEARDALGIPDELALPEGTRDALGWPEELGLPESDAVPVGIEGLMVMLASMEALWAALAVSHPLRKELRDAEGEEPPEGLNSLGDAE